MQERLEKIISGNEKEIPLTSNKIWIVHFSRSDTTRAKVHSQNTKKCSANNYINLIFILPVTSPKNLVEFYNEMWNIRDRRVDDWFLMQSIWPTITLCVCYLYFSIALGPWLMKNREPFQIYPLIQLYNVFVTLLSAYMVYEIGMSGWFTHYNWVCQEVETDPDPKSP